MMGAVRHVPSARGSRRHPVGSATFPRPRLAALAGVVLAAVSLMCVPGRPLRAASPRPDAPASEPRRSDPIWRGGRVDPAAGLPGRYEREFARRRARLEAARPGAAAAVLPLLGAAAVLHGEVDEERLLRWLERAAADRRLDPVVRGEARRQRARILERTGRPAEAARILRRAGYVLDWIFVGPFAYAGPDSLDAPPACAAEPYDSQRTFAGAVPGEELSWRPYDYEGAPDGGFVGFDEYLAPNEKVFSCATTWIRLPRRTDVGLAVGSGGAYRLWVDGEPVGGNDVRRLPHPLQDVHGVRLGPGWHRLTIAVATEHEPWGFYLRMSDRRGRPLPRVSIRAAPPEDRAGAGPDGPGPPPTGPRVVPIPADRVRSLHRALLGRAETARGPGPVADLVEFEWRVHPFALEDTRTVERIRAQERKATNFRLTVLRAHVETDETARTEAMERAVELGLAAGRGPEVAPLLAELALRHGAVGLDRKAQRTLQRALALAPDDPQIESFAISMLEERGFELAALAWSEDLLRRHPRSRTAREDLAARLAAVGRLEEALATLEAAPVLSGTAQTRAVRLALRMGKVDRAVELARARVAAEPARPGAHAALARVYEAAGRPKDAWAAMARALRLAPLDPDLHADAARMAMRQGQAAAALAELRRSLQLRPQQPDLRDLLAVLSGTSRHDWFARHALSLESAVAVEIPARWRNRRGVVLSRKVAIWVHDNGLSERLDHRILRIGDERGARDLSVQSIYFDPDQSYAEVRRARVRRPDGTVASVGRTSMVSLAQAGYRMYYDKRRLDVVFDGLRPGDVVEVAFLVRDTAARNMFDTYFGDMQPVGGLDPVLRFEYVVDAPADLPLYFRGGTPAVTVRGDRRIYRRIHREVPPVEPEAHMPGFTQVVPYEHASSYRSWEGVARWYWNLVADQLVVDDRIREAVAQAVAGIDPGQRRARMEAIYAYVVRNTRYVGLEFGIHGYKPYRTTEVFARRYGDCKDKAALLKVMLAEVGIDSHLVLVRTRDLGSVDPFPASLAPFNHAIVYVPEFQTYLDGTAEWSGPAELPAADRGAFVVHVEDGGRARVATIPLGRPEDNRSISKMRVRLGPQGDALVEVDLEQRGVDAAALRYAFQAPSRRRERAAAMLAQIFASPDVEAVEVFGIEDIRRPARVRIRARVQQVATPDGDLLRVPVLGHEQSWTRRWASQARRRYLLVLPPPFVEQQEVEFLAPDGYVFRSVPGSAEAGNDVFYVAYEVEVSPDQRRAVVRARFELRQGEVPPGRYEAFRAALKAADRILARPILVGRRP